MKVLLDKKQAHFLKSCISTQEGVTFDEAVSQATENIEALKTSYKEWLNEQIERLVKAYKTLEKAERPQNGLKLLYHIAHDIKSLGKTFHYELITDIAHSLSHLITYSSCQNLYPQEAIYLHIKALCLVISHDIQGSGGKMEQQLLQGLKQVVDKICLKPIHPFLVKNLKNLKIYWIKFSNHKN